MRRSFTSDGLGQKKNNVGQQYQLDGNADVEKGVGPQVGVCENDTCDLTPCQLSRARGKSWQNIHTQGPNASPTNTIPWMAAKIFERDPSGVQSDM